MDVLAEYQKLKREAADADVVVVRAEAALEAAEASARAIAEEAGALGFDSMEAVERKRDELLAEAEAAIVRVQEALA